MKIQLPKGSIYESIYHTPFYNKETPTLPTMSSRLTITKYRVDHDQLLPCCSSDTRCNAATFLDALMQLNWAMQHKTRESGRFNSKNSVLLIPIVRNMFLDLAIELARLDHSAKEKAIWNMICNSKTTGYLSYGKDGQVNLLSEAPINHLAHTLIETLRSWLYRITNRELFLQLPTGEKVVHSDAHDTVQNFLNTWIQRHGATERAGRIHRPIIVNEIFRCFQDKSDPRDYGFDPNTPFWYQTQVPYLVAHEAPSSSVSSSSVPMTNSNSFWALRTD